MKLCNPVDLIIINEDHQLLLAKRKSKRYGYENNWSIPGGRAEPGETFEQALLREIQEELNCTVKDLKYFTSTYMELEDVSARTVYFYGKIEGNIILQESELIDYKWFSMREDDLLNLDFAFNQKQVVQDFIKYYLSLESVKNL